MKNPFRAWLMDQPRTVTRASLGRDLDLHRTYVSDLMEETSTVMPSLSVALRIQKRTKGVVSPKMMHDFVMLNRVKQGEAA